MKTIILLAIALSVSTSLTAQTNKSKLEITHLTGDYYVFTTYQAFGKTLFPANGMYLVTNKGVVLFDTPWDTTQFKPLLDSIYVKHHAKVVLCIATHSHEDRTGGLEFLRQQGVETYTSKLTDELCKAKNHKRPIHTFSKDTVFTVGQYSFQTFYGGPGHTVDNIILWCDADKILYGGCLVKSTEATDLGYIGEADLKKWPTTIQNIQKKFGQPLFIIPGHQDWTNPRALDYTLDLLSAHEKKKKH